MSAVILVAGMRGVGKSTLLETYSDRMICLEAESVQAEAIRIEKGEDFESPYSWEVWDDNLRTKAETLLTEALSRKYPDLQSSNQPILLVGALLQRDWFREAFLKVISVKFPVQVKNPCHYLLHLDAATISSQIEKRGRVDEKEYVGNLSKIECERDGYFSGANKVWLKVQSHCELSSLIQERI